MPPELVLRINIQADEGVLGAGDCLCGKERRLLNKLYDDGKWVLCEQHMAPSPADADDEGDTFFAKTFVPHVLGKDIENRCTNESHKMELQYKAMTHWESCGRTPSISSCLWREQQQLLTLDTDLTSCGPLWRWPIHPSAPRPPRNGLVQGQRPRPRPRRQRPCKLSHDVRAARTDGLHQGHAAPHAASPRAGQGEGQDRTLQLQVPPIWRHHWLRSGVGGAHGAHCRQG
mmetsp:Transcript_31496/g.77199  ORF Transcript_31496/g.77199 Transcript_31496/m.77199 type:complete len:230 (-) Transcript_31496:632-1321(-)